MKISVKRFAAAFAATLAIGITLAAGMIYAALAAVPVAP